MKKIIALLIMALVVITFTACETTLDSIKSNFKREYGITLPNDTELLYSYYESKDSFHGDGIDYYVFGFKEEPVNIIEKFKSSNLKEDENSDELINNLKDYFESAINMVDEIPQEHLPKWENQMIWNYDGESYGGFPAIYYPDSMVMIVCIVTI